MKNRRFRSVLAAMLVTGLVLTGCAAAPAAPAASSSGGEAAAEAEAPAGEAGEAADWFNESGWPVVNEPVTIHVFGSRNSNQPEDFNEYELVQDWEKTTGVHIEWELVDDSVYAEKLALKLASGDYPEIIMNGVSSTDLTRYGAEGVFIPLEDLMDKYCPQLQTAFEQVPAMKGAVTMPDGHIYSFPTTGLGPWMGLNRIGAINTDWLEALGLEMPTTLDEFEQVLIAFRDGDPNGNGEADEIPLSWRGALNSNLSANGGWGMGLNWLADSFGIPDPTTHFDLAEDGKTVRFVPVTEEWKEFIIWLNKLYNEGLLDPTGFSQDGDQYKAKLTADPPIVGVCSCWELGDDMADYSAYDHYDYLDPMAGLDGSPATPYYSPYDYGKGYWVVTSACEHPEVAVRVIDYVYDELISLQFLEGKIGVRMVECTEGDGGYMVADPPEGMNTQTWRFQVCPAGKIPFYARTEAYLQYQHLHYTDKKAAKIRAIAEYAPAPVGILNYTVEEADLVSQVNAELYDFVNRRAAEWVMNGGIEDEWDAYLEEVNSMQFEEFMAAVQRAQDVFAAAMAGE